MNKKEFDIERKSYDNKIEEIRKQKRKLRDIQEPSLVKKIKKELKTEQRSYKRSEKNELKEYIKAKIGEYNELDIEELIFDLREMLFHNTDETALPIIEKFLINHPELLEIHDKEWYLKNC